MNSDKRYLVDVSDIFLFYFLLGGGEGGSPRRQEGGGDDFIENPRRGGGFPGQVGTKEGRGREGVCPEFGGGG